ncbi:uncharacterized protein LOC111452155 isoform X1 [Cucurbita moschata]|uniref:Uncharacterized protein LOC111452155 isoform X1 n=3 Tax=Cucurbita TaxID=3660 RepID=A0A6J1G9G0_CUCMO|nr:uncharacterized protein LOC111452155 isoform X1 [Cucurbita moschata]XP_022948493.1 uncharacterized protein LOC111452155 isoform X1 [Cucurbita moschata]XP_022948494.1 uncharacterized protein LOC111452155 isoform X1 [Cucurbita moschata]
MALNSHCLLPSNLRLPMLIYIIENDDTLLENLSSKNLLCKYSMASAFSSWLCSYGAKSKLVRIVHPGGHIELHDGPIRAAEIMLRNPEFSLTHSQSANHPWAIVSPDTTLMLGCKYYLLPENSVGNPQKMKENGGLESDCLNGGKCMMCFVPKEKGERTVRWESGDDLKGNDKRVFLQNGNIRGSPKRPFGSSDNWEPNLNSISEEY